ncbi:tRNA 2-selenouridine(34) synthase MnmH [Algoriphagus namhaensis]
MAESLISLAQFLSLRESTPLVDARSEAEFFQSHIPGAQNLPILTNEERVVVGTLYKKQGSEAAILKGFQLVGPRFHEIQKRAIEAFPGRQVLIYCWRGGMRSQILSWLLSMVGFAVFRLEGGYKAYRTHTFRTVREPRKLLVLGGKTGTGKTRLLHGLMKEGEQVVDLEGLAGHKGSSFGGIAQNPQPSVEQFENLLAEKLWSLDSSKLIWVENESRRIGKILLPDPFYLQMLRSPFLSISTSREERIQLIEEEYGRLDKSELSKAALRIQKKLGGLRTKEVLEAIETGDTEKWIGLVLDYYDKAYDFDLKNHKTPYTFQLDLSRKETDESLTELMYVRQKIEREISN